MNSRTIRPLLAFFVLVAFAHRAMAVEEHTAVWTGASISGDISNGSRWSYWFDLSGRYYEPGSGARQYFARPGLLYAFSDRLEFGGGYGRGYTHAPDELRAVEERFWEQLTWSLPAGDGSQLSLRLRLEQRLLDVADDLRHRARLRLKYQQPMRAGASTKFVLAMEPMFDLNETDWGGDRGLSQLRVYAGIDVNTGTPWGFELGYFNQYLFGETGPDRVVHIASLQLKYRP